MGRLSFNQDFNSKNTTKNEALQDTVLSHLESFNFFLDEGLDEVIKSLLPVETEDCNGKRIIFKITEIRIGNPKVASDGSFLYPHICRESKETYKGPLTIVFQCTDGISVYEKTFPTGEIPIMVKSNRCNINNYSSENLIRVGEEENEIGGYFIINGNEKMIRLLILPRRNYILAVKRTNFSKKGFLFTSTAVQIRCVHRDSTSKTLTLHYLSNGFCVLRFTHNRVEYLIPSLFILKALKNITDKEIYLAINPEGKNSFIGDRVEEMLRELLNFGILTRDDALSYLGNKFRVVLGRPQYHTNHEVGQFLINQYIFIHLEQEKEKFDLLINMIQKLYGVIHGDSKLDDSDKTMNHEVLLPGHLYLMHFKENLQFWLNSLKKSFERCIHKKKLMIAFSSDETFLIRVLSSMPVSLEQSMTKFLATGDIGKASLGLGLMQKTGLVVHADKLNFIRFVSHFRSIHRGAFFTEIKTTTVRKLLPESWGFLCPVHTPDGAPCGLLNHLSYTCKIQARNENSSSVPSLAVGLGMIPSHVSSYPLSFLHVNLNGKIIGYIDSTKAQMFCDQLRFLKVSNQKKVPSTMEIVHIPKETGGLFPGVFLYSTPCRMLRPVYNLITSTVELIGTLEQVFLNIAVTEKEIYPETTHVELHPTNILSIVANLTPFSDLNQSPRNMYQCQMGKQTIGTSMTAYKYRTDYIIYRLVTPQAPIVRTLLYNQYEMDQFPQGTNAIVAVISYTGYDMEDAMILNKSSVERGFAHGIVYKQHIIDLSQPTYNFERFGTLSSDLSKLKNKVGQDGIPILGTKVEHGDPLACTINDSKSSSRIIFYKGNESAYIDEVRVLSGKGKLSSISGIILSIKLRINRNPIIGDKFSSRHGQKGVCSKLWPCEDMPFTESGITPDLIINPHAFPSRMTIGMLVESMAGKSGALHGACLDSTPFTFNEKDTAYEYFGKQLVKAGYNYYGNETMYSGITGTQLDVDIFIGIVYYQRLRHMVSDKFQVRTTGPVDLHTRQPVHGKKRKGGVRFGEMERDSLLSHGTSFLLHDRLFNCSDGTTCYICAPCGSVVSPYFDSSILTYRKGKVVCRTCKSSSEIEVITIPYVFKYLISELMAMNIKIQFELKSTQ